MITYKTFLTTDKNSVVQSQSDKCGVDSIIVEENPSPCMLTSQRGIFIRLLQEEGLLQVGNIDTNCDVFVVKVLMKNIKFLDVIASNCDVSSDRSCHEFYINYMLLGNPHIRSLDKKFNRIHQIQEKVSINFRSSLKSLKEYFDNIFYIPIEVYRSTRRIGTLEIRLKNNIPSTNLQEFIQIYPKGYEFDGVAEIKTAQKDEDSQNQPVMEYKVMIQYKATKKLHQTELLENYKRQKTQGVYDPQGGGDNLSIIPEKLENKQEDDDEIREIQPDHHFPEVEVKAQKKSEAESKLYFILFPTKQKNNLYKHFLDQTIKKIETPEKKVVQKKKAIIESILNEQEQGKIDDLPRLFSYNLQLKSIKLNHKPIRGVYQISFYHEKADTPRTFINRDIQDNECIDEKNLISFNDLELKLYFTSKNESIMKIIKSSSVCTLCIKGPMNVHAKAFLDCKSLLISNKENLTGNILLTNQNESVTTMAQIYVYLEDSGVNFNAARICKTESQVFNEEQPPYSSNTLPVVVEHKVSQELFDEDIAYKMIQELEDFKEREQETFLLDLKKKELLYIEEFKAAFWKKKQQYLQEMAEKSEKLSELTKTLEETQQSIVTQNVHMQHKSSSDIQNIKRDLEHAFKNQLVVIKTRAKQLEDDLFHELKINENKIEELEQRKSFLEEENCELKQIIEKSKRDGKFKMINSVPCEEHDRVLRELVRPFNFNFNKIKKFFNLKATLQENYKRAIESKLHYKDEWAKAFRQYHNLYRARTFETREENVDKKFER